MGNSTETESIRRDPETMLTVGDQMKETHDSSIEGYSVVYHRNEFRKISKIRRRSTQWVLEKRIGLLKIEGDRIALTRAGIECQQSDHGQDFFCWMNKEAEKKNGRLTVNKKYRTIKRTSVLICMEETIENVRSRLKEQDERCQIAPGIYRCMIMRDMETEGENVAVRKTGEQ